METENVDVHVRRAQGVCSVSLLGIGSPTLCRVNENSMVSPATDPPY